MALVLASLHQLFVHVVGVALFPAETKKTNKKKSNASHLDKAEKKFNPLVGVNRA